VGNGEKMSHQISPDRTKEEQDAIEQRLFRGFSGYYAQHEFHPGFSTNGRSELHSGRFARYIAECPTCSSHYVGHSVAWHNWTDGVKA
jgi:hypothetical protein